MNRKKLRYLAKNRTRRADVQAESGKPWLAPLRAIVASCCEDVPKLIRTGKGADVVVIKPDEDPAIKAELHVENLVSYMLSKQSIPLSLYSEESGYLLHAPRARYVVLLDPIDGTFLAIRNLPGSCIAISVHDAKTMEPVAAMVGDYYSQDIYWATSEGAFKNGTSIHPSSVTTLDKAYISTCYGKASRIPLMLAKKGIVNKAFWIETTGTMLSMVWVGTGQVDVYLDLMLGYKPHDLAAGAYIAKMAGAVVTDELGNDLRYPADLTTRCKFVIAANEKLHSAIMRAATESRT